MIDRIETGEIIEIKTTSLILKHVKFTRRLNMEAIYSNVFISSMISFKICVEPV